ncbi:TetR family transcriptional regulator [Subtercola boreus]|uniref:TetR family transcriptional regulator n=2 Tax=Subtercola boreus TaxID=120213 RepID=A0A3E0VNB3_9MICO|nr:TetR family transcriptional regulator [Subtercola boreus]TQL53774.1 TetR family transcriptional regulator [Subtercola boreus]
MSQIHTAAHASPVLRADAAENRESLLDAARALFAERGLDVPMRVVAREAGVGPATLYRRFPTRASLIEAAFADEMRLCREIVEDASADRDPWRGFCMFLRRIGELNARNQGFTEAFLSTFPASEEIAAHRVSMLRSLAGLCRRAQAAGALRADAGVDDLVLILQAGRGVTATTPERRVLAARRFAELAIDAFRATPPGLRDGDDR